MSLEPPPLDASPLLRRIDAAVDAMEQELVEFRRDLHAHPELAFAETRTTERVADRLAAEDIGVQELPKSGLIAQVGPSEGPVVALRADLDALPVDDQTSDPWRSVVDGVAHACGHDVHVACLLGAGLALQQLHVEGRLSGPVRLLFQPAEEIMPGGALEMIAAGALDDVSHAFGLHCDPSLDVGHVGLRVGAITGAADSMRVRLSGRGGHTSRPHLTQDLTYALGTLITQLPAALSRRLDPRAGASVVWGLVRAGSATNVIPAAGEAAGTVRMLDAVAWADAECLVRGLIEQLVAPYGVTAEVTYVRGVPPVVNEPGSTALLTDAVTRVLGDDGLVTTTQSLGGEDFGWYLETVSGSMGRLGTRTPGGPTFDLHQGDLRIDERAVAIGAKVLAHSAFVALRDA
ncbi:MAG: N-acyl-L-amino acid amidohydrolase [uncultured Nocardioidaceae bacterium]|uniref:N-acyl-L-amino acid amidohydrolase n=1 Tax=uncultured Nocardioidaceae bacterium TaxID=253824 RepID=A0A6J4LUP0_9ACTN|nr:MAG: N-acyl-L-amino acid amidohydrolase [uncultured Nocardioidaceae bacterium]